MLLTVGLLMVGGACKGWADNYLTYPRIASLIVSVKHQ